MLARRWSPPVFLALLSLGFLGQSPVSPQVDRRHISSCEDPSIKPHSVALPTSLFSFVQTDNAMQAAQAYQNFLMSMQINAIVNPFAIPSAMGFGMPAFPSFVYPVDHYVAPTPLAYSGLAWHGLLQDPQLQYLIHPSQPLNASAPVGSLDALVGTSSLQTTGALGFTVGNSAIVASPAAAPIASPTGNQISRL